MENNYEHKHPFRIRPCDDEWCIVTKDNEGYDITVAEDLSDPLAKWMCDALNAAWNARAGGWRDIESAPKNEEVLVWSDWQDSAYLAICKANEYETYEWWVPDTDTSQGGWVELLASPTHWQPLPAPPDSPLKGRKEGEE